MKKIILVYGLIAGAIAGGMLMVTMPLYESGTLHLENGQWLGYTTMVLALSMTFFGIKSYRDNHAHGRISFWGGLKVGLLITLIASIVYAASWEITRLNMKGDFMQQYATIQMEKMKADGATQQAMTEAKQQMESFSEMYKNPIFRFTFSIIEIAPVGILLSLISAGLLRRKEFLPATSNE